MSFLRYPPTEKSRSCRVIGMIHLPPLPGTPSANGSGIANLVEHVETEAAIYREAGVDAVMIENMHDRPYLKGAVGPEIISAMTLAAIAVKQEFDGPCGVQVLAAANREALAIAYAAGLDFIRAEGFVFAHVADEGLIESEAGTLLRYRREIGAEKVAVLADIKKKHSSHTLTADIDLAGTAEAAEFFLADGVIVTGASTGHAPAEADLSDVRNAVEIPVLVGSGVTADNISAFASHCDAVIVGSSLKEDGKWTGILSPEKIRLLLDGLRQPK
ncbi:MAG: BtpA/SgcQ family protein [Verrucomicrobiota bacterium]